MSPRKNNSPRKGGKVFSTLHNRLSLGGSLGLTQSRATRANPHRPQGAKQLRRLNKPKDTIQGITKPDIRRLARRGGVKRISLGIYTEARAVLKKYLYEVSVLGLSGLSVDSARLL